MVLPRRCKWVMATECRAWLGTDLTALTAILFQGHTYVHTHTYTCMHTHVRIHTHTHTHTWKHTHIQSAHTHTHIICACTHTNHAPHICTLKLPVYSNTDIHIPPYTQPQHVHAHTETYTMYMACIWAV